MRILTVLVCAMFVSRLSATVVDVSISGFAFNPSNVTVSVGDTVRWTNRDAVAHTSTSGKPDSSPGQLWDSPYLSQNQSWSLPVTFVASNVPYYCRPHPSMRAHLTSLAGVSEDRHRAVGRIALGVPAINPSSVTVTLDRPGRVTVKIRDVQGRVAAALANSRTVRSGTTRLPVPSGSLRNGVYAVMLETSSGTVSARLVVVR